MTGGTGHLGRGLWLTSSLLPQEWVLSDKEGFGQGEWRSPEALLPLKPPLRSHPCKHSHHMAAWPGALTGQ